MTQIRPFRPYLVSADRAGAVVAPAYDSMLPAERAVFSSENPSNFINAMRVEEEFPESARPSEKTLLQRNRATVRGLLDDGSFRQFDQDAVYVYRLQTEDHVQTSVVAEVPIDEYHSGRIRRHEHTRPDHEDRLTRYLEVVGVSSSPVCLAYPDNPSISAVLSEITSRTPELNFLLNDRVRQRVWCVTDKGDIQTLQNGFSAVSAAYLTDGHHRTAASSRYFARQVAEADDHGSNSWKYFLAALFPTSELRILAFNRCVRDLNGLSLQRLVDGISEHFAVEPLADPQKATLPQSPGEFVRWGGESVYRLRVRQESVPQDPVLRLDVSLLQNLILERLLGIANSRSDARLDYVTGNSGLEGLRQRLSEGWQVAFACFPTSMSDLMAVADLGRVMPAKSTCFDPKVRSGIFLRFF
jgi:uncharacterized protein (DUF1015 family)